MRWRFINGARESAMKNSIWRSLFSLLACVALAALSASAFSATNQLPSCTVTAEQVEKESIPAKDLVWVGVDSHGNFFAAWESSETRLTSLDQYGVPRWTSLGNGSQRMQGGYWGLNFYATIALEEKICGIGKKVLFYERIYDGSFYGVTVNGILPKPHTLVNEVIYPESRTYFLASLGAESDFILDGGAGRGWVTSSNGFRLPRAGDNLIPVHRFYGQARDGGFHFYTVDVADIEMLQAITYGARYTYEGVAFLAPRATRKIDGTYECSDAQTVPVARLRDGPPAENRPVSYRYVVNPKLAEIMVRRGWNDQGATFCALKDG
jgi:Repeat of unknown function (DUF5648)